MERTQILDLMGTLKLYGMRSAYDEVMAAGIKRQHEPPRIVGDLLQSEIAEIEPVVRHRFENRWRGARSIRYQMTIAKLPLAKDIEQFDFGGTPINEGLVRDLASGGFVADQRNVVLIGGTGTGKTHLVIGIARALIRGGTRGRFFNVVDLVNRLETETRGGKQGRTADYLTRLDFIVLDELGYLPFAQSGGQLRRRENSPPDCFLILLHPPHQPPLRAHLDHRHHEPRLRRMAHRLRRRQDDRRSARPSHPSLRDRRDRQRILALQEPRLTTIRA
jgi:DNA replication protein DnaC